MVHRFTPSVVQIAEAYHRLRDSDLKRIRNGERIRVPVQMPVMESYYAMREMDPYMPVDLDVSSVEFSGRFERGTPDGRWWVVRETYGNAVVHRLFVPERRPSPTETQP